MEREAENERKHCLQGVVAHACAYNKKIKIKIKREAKPSKNLLSIRDQRIFIATSLSAPH